MKETIIYRVHSNNIVFSLGMIVVFFFVYQIPLNAAEMLSAFEQGNLNTSTGGFFREYESDRTHGPDYQTITVDNSQGAEGTSACLSDTVTEGNIYIMYYANPDRKVLIPQASGANRMSFYIKLPDGYPLANDYNFHVGTYTRDPINGDPFQNGDHYYHYFNITGSNYWTKIVCNTHPNHQVGVKVDPGNDPVPWGYYNGFTRFYLDMQPQSPVPLPWTGYVDEIKFYYVDEPENDDTINSISCIYFGNGRFQIGWHGNSQYSHNGHRYEVRYSNTPITNANYSSATVVPGGPFRRTPESVNFMKAGFTINNVKEGSRYFFAIKDIDSGIPYVSKIDYLVNGSTGDNSPPLPPVGISIGIE